MARKKSHHLTDVELKLMEVLWEKGTATVADVVESLAQASKGPPPAYSTVLTMLRILEKKGHVRHTKRGRAFVYQRCMYARRRRSPPSGICCGGSSKIP